MTEKTVEEKIAIANLLVASLNATAHIPKVTEEVVKGVKQLKYNGSFTVSVIPPEIQEGLRNKLMRIIVDLVPEPPQPVVSEQAETKA